MINEDLRSTGTATQAAPKRSLAASTIGQVLEWYEWSAYAVFAPFISIAMFSSEHPVSALLATLAVFAVGFLMRPLGGIVFGYLADRRGRKWVLITTMLLMAGGSVAISVMPTFAQVGIWASVLLLLVRMVQGFAHGGESATANSYAAEIAPTKKRGLWGSFVYASIFAGSIIAYSLGGVITLNATETFIAEWGWRIPFVLGAVLALVALWMRRGMAESAVFDEATTASGKPVGNQRTAPVALSSTDKKRQVMMIVLVVTLVSGLTAAHYTWTSYVSTYAIVQQGMDANAAYWVTVVAQAIALTSLPFWGRISDRVGRKPVLYIFAAGMAITQFPLMMLINDQPWTLLVSTSVALLIVSAMGAVTSAVMAEVFPTAQRTRNIGLAYSLSVALFGGFAPYINQLFNSLGMNWMANLYVVVLCVVTFITVTRLAETKGLELSAVR